MNQRSFRAIWEAELDQPLVSLTDMGELGYVLVATESAEGARLDAFSGEDGQHVDGTTIPLAGDNDWTLTTTGQISLQHIEAISLSLDSWGGEPFTVWLDGLTVD